MPPLVPPLTGRTLSAGHAGAFALAGVSVEMSEWESAVGFLFVAPLEECLFGKLFAQYARSFGCDMNELEDWRIIVGVEAGDRHFFFESD